MADGDGGTMGTCMSAGPIIGPMDDIIAHAITLAHANQLPLQCLQSAGGHESIGSTDYSISVLLLECAILLTHPLLSVDVDVC